MYQLNVSDMACGHCVGSITQALKRADPQAPGRDFSRRQAGAGADRFVAG